jgi:hypothetical protein
MKTAKDKINYLKQIILPALEKAFKRGDKKYTGTNRNDAPRIMRRSADEDIRHIRELHVDVRLREAEEAADNGDLQMALEKIESAMGYLTILHARMVYKLDINILKKMDD